MAQKVPPGVAFALDQGLDPVLPVFKQGIDHGHCLCR